MNPKRTEDDYRKVRKPAPPPSRVHPDRRREKDDDEAGREAERETIEEIRRRRGRHV